MIKVGETTIIEKVSELPNFSGVDTIYMDLETTAFSDKNDGAFYPYNGDRMYAAAFALDDSPEVFYLPIRQRTSDNLPLDNVRSFLNDMFRASRRWVNQNVKFDAHFLQADGITAFETKELVDTKSRAQTIDSDRPNHSLKPLCRDWLGMDMAEETEIKAFLKSIKSKDYARIPTDMSARYAGMDVIGARALNKYCEARSEGLEKLWKTETALTSVLYRMEKRGVRIHRDLLRDQTATCIRKIINLMQELKDLTGMEYVDSNDLKYEILCDRLKLPILAYTEPDKNNPGRKTSPSFDKEALLMYAGHPDVLHDEKKARIVALLREIGEEDTYNSSYLIPLGEFITDDDRVHPQYNQNVRTGRMSCSNPNGMALSPRAKELFGPSDGFGFACQDASQMEYRIIVHYCEIPEAIVAYNTDPKTDYHSWVAGMCGIKRKPAKNLNFAMAFGSGKAKTIRMLAFDPDVIAAIAPQLEKVPENQRSALYVKLATELGERIYNDYHTKLPEVRRTSEKARALCARRGWIRNLFGRKRHLPANLDYRAFNSLIQSCAADLIKERMVALEPYLLQNGVYMLMQVHDELLEEGPKEVLQDPTFKEGMLKILCDVPAEFKVPFIWETGYSDKNWKEAKP